MTLAKSEPRKGGFEKRILERGKCHYIVTKMVADPLRSEQIARLADSVVPPSDGWRVDAAG